MQTVGRLLGTKTGVDVLDIEINQAKPEDSERLKQIAIASKSYWGYSEHLISQWAQTPIITPESIGKDKPTFRTIR